MVRTKKLGKYIPSQIEEKWQKRWDKEGLHVFKPQKEKDSYYNLVELAYPSGDLHLGHWFTFVNADAHARFMKMSGKNVFFPNGFDAFGLPAENAAIKRNVHPQDWTMKNIETMKGQFATMGTMIDWSHEAITCLPEYYSWNQWIFIKMFEKGLAYRGKALSNWCPSCQTVLANEGIEDGKCWRCGSVVEQKEIEQWFLKITALADELLWDNTDEKKRANGVDWPKSVREGQNNWIGRSEGANIQFQISNFKFQIDVFTTRPDTLYGATFLVLSPEHPVVTKLLNSEFRVESSELTNVREYVEAAKKKTEMERKEQKEKTGVFSGLYALHPITKEEIPVWVADYVLWGYGTGAIMAVPAHDERDFEFAKKYNLNIKPVIAPFGNAIILHGCPDDAQDVLPREKRWMNWLEKELIKLGIESVAPEMPTSWNPHYEEWKKEFEKYSVDENTVLVGHSCGAAFLVRWLLEKKKRVKKLILVAPAKIPDPKSDRRIELYNFDLAANDQMVAEEVVIFISNDEERHIKSAMLYQKAFNARIIEIPEKQHFAYSQIKTNQVPELLDEILYPNGQISTKGSLINSGDWNGIQMPDEMTRVIDWLEEKKIAKRRVQYHLHDWSVSRQRYWGTPVPIIYCVNCWDLKSPASPKLPLRRVEDEASQRGEQKSNLKAEYGRDYAVINGKEHAMVPVPFEQLPVELPYEVDYTPKGKPPLATAEKWLNVKCPKCGGDAKRDAETLDTFFDSSWYYYRYVSPHDDKEPFDPELVEGLLPVDIYFGGAEHTLGHTLYARFFTKFFKAEGLIEFSEFAKKRVQHGIILGPDGFRMSKSRGNVVNPDDVVKEYGADTVRLYLAFMMPFEATATWNPTAISGIYRFLRRVWELYEKTQPFDSAQGESAKRLALSDKTDLYWMHKTIKKVGEDLRDIKFNTAVSTLMEWLNHLSRKEQISLEEYKTLLLLLAPLAPHMTEELWQNIHTVILSDREGSKKDSSSRQRRTQNDNAFDSIHAQDWPEYDEKYLVEDVVTIVVQVNGKVRENIQMQSAESREQSAVEKRAKESDKVRGYLEGKTVKKVIYIEGILLNFVVS